MERELISIIIPAFNVSKYIKKCLQSIQMQTYKKIEIIVVDDVSTDDTTQIVKRMLSQDNRIQLICMEQNSGSAAARQTGIQHSKGNLITFVDADDWYCNQNALQHIVEVYESTHADCIMYGYRTIHKYRLIIKKRFNGRPGLYTIQEVAEKKACDPSPYWHYLWNKCFKAELLKSGQIQFCPELRHAEDVRLNADFLKCAQTYYVMKNAYYYDYNCANINQITRISSPISFQSEAANFEHLKEELIRLLNDYSLIGASVAARKGLYVQFYRNVVRILDNNKAREWNTTLVKTIHEDDAYQKCIDELGNQMKEIEKEVDHNNKLVSLKQKIKVVFRM